MNLKQAFKEYYSILLRNDFPQDIICSHHGVWFPYQTLDVKITTAGAKSNKLLVIVGERLWVFDEQRRAMKEKTVTRKTHQKRVKVIQQALSEIYQRDVKVHTSWNGNNDDSSVSVVFDIEAPKTLFEAISNYHNLDNVFEPFSHSFHEHIETHEPAWIAEHQAMYKKKRAVERTIGDTYKKLANLKRAGLNDVVELCSQFVDNRVLTALNRI